MKTLFIISVIVYLIYTFLISTKALHMLQQNRYNRGLRYIKWIINHFKENFLNISLIFVIFIFFFISESLIAYLPYLFMLVYVFLAYVFISERKKDITKIPLKYTDRIKRIITTNMIVHILVAVIMVVTFNEDKLPIYYFIFGLINYLNLFVILVINFINRPIEKMVEIHFRNMAVDKLRSMNTMDVIGITGSYGKTSSKNILCDILNVKYNAFKTPQNYNTPYGLMISINNFLDK